MKKTCDILMMVTYWLVFHSFDFNDRPHDNSLVSYISNWINLSSLLLPSDIVRWW